MLCVVHAQCIAQLLNTQHFILPSILACIMFFAGRATAVVSKGGWYRDQANHRWLHKNQEGRKVGLLLPVYHVYQHDAVWCWVWEEGFCCISQLVQVAKQLNRAKGNAFAWFGACDLVHSPWSRTLCTSLNQFLVTFIKPSWLWQVVISESILRLHYFCGKKMLGSFRCKLGLKSEQLLQWKLWFYLCMLIVACITVDVAETHWVQGYWQVDIQMSVYHANLKGEWPYTCLDEVIQSNYHAVKCCCKKLWCMKQDVFYCSIYQCILQYSDHL